MMVQDKLIILEEKLNKLLEDYDKLKQERDTLLIKHDDLCSHIKDIEAENSLLKKNKAAVKEKIETMLQKLDS